MQSETKALIFIAEDGSFPFVLPMMRFASADEVREAVGNFMYVLSDCHEDGHQPQNGFFTIATADLDEVQDLFDGKGVPDYWPDSFTVVAKLPFYGDPREAFVDLTTG